MLALLALGLLSAAPNSLRWNRLGYPSEGRAKVILAASDSDLTGRAWRAVPPDGSEPLVGTLAKSATSATGQSPWTRHHRLDLSAAKVAGTWKVVLQGFDTAKVLVATEPWSRAASLAVRHLGAMRSGTRQVLDWRKPSHLGDSACTVWVPDPPADTGSWSPTSRTLSLQGGWYDAGDYIKFTLTTAGTTWFLLRAYEENPSLHASLRSGDLPDILDEARHGLRYLLQLFPDDTTFVIQVGDGRDHSQGSRLPERDRLDGDRPALSALSPAHMGLTAAALALGARTFAGLPAEQALADTCERLSRRLMERMLTAPRREHFLRDPTNDFYRDMTLHDNMALGAAELFRTTGDSTWLGRARSWIDSAGQAYWASWGDWNLMAAERLKGHAEADAVLDGDLTGFVKWSRTSGAPWGIPMQQHWAPFDGYPQVAAAAIRSSSSDTARSRMAWDIWDYMAGRNNWGVSFLMDTANPSAVRNIYSQIYPLSRQPAIGAVAEGPGSRESHEELSQYFDLPDSPVEEPFNTASVVFFDDATDFQTMETTIGIQGAFLHMVSCLSRELQGSGSSGTGHADRPAANRAVLRSRGSSLSWFLPASVPGSLRLVDASGRSETLRGGILQEQGSVTIRQSATLRWAVLETRGTRTAIALPPVLP